MRGEITIESNLDKTLLERKLRQRDGLTIKVIKDEAYEFEDEDKRNTKIDSWNLIEYKD